MVQRSLEWVCYSAVQLAGADVFSYLFLYRCAIVQEKSLLCRRLFYCPEEVDFLLQIFHDARQPLGIVQELLREGEAFLVGRDRLLCARDDFLGGIRQAVHAAGDDLALACDGFGQMSDRFKLRGERFADGEGLLENIRCLMQRRNAVDRGVIGRFQTCGHPFHPVFP